MSFPTPSSDKPVALLADVPSRPKVPAVKLPFFSNCVLWATTPALALFAFAALLPQTPPRPINGVTASNGSIISASEWVVAASDTILVTRQSAGKYSLLHGQLEVTKGDAITSSASGVVTQISVRRGQSIRVGQQVAVLSTGIVPTESLSQAPSPVENLQSRAESAQVAAAQQQEKLESRMNAANAELQRAKERVATAQQRVAGARQLISRLRSGEKIAADEAPSARVGSTPQANPKRERNNAANAAALRESQKLQDAAEASEASAKAAQKAARDADAVADAKQQKLKSALAAAKTTSAKTKSSAAGDAGSTPDNSADSKAPKERAVGDDVAVSSARELANSASEHAADLKREAARQQSRSEQARSKANAAARRATQGLQVFDGATESSSVAPRKSSAAKSDSGEKMTVSQAARIAQSALKESEAAIKNAERIQKKVESYGRPVASTRQKFNQAAQQLEAAQQQMWDRAPTMQTRSVTVISQRSGIVTWVAGPTTVVHGGDVIASVGRPDRLEVVVEDKTNAWKSLKPDSRVLALVQRQPTSIIAPGAGSTPSTGSVKSRPIAAMTRGSEGDTNIPTLARVLFIAPPSKAGQAARVRIAVHNPPASGNNANGSSLRAFKPGMKVFFSVAQPSKQTAIRIPTAAVRRSDTGKTFVAVLAPIDNSAQDRLANQCRVEWREVLLAPGDGINNRVKSGLKEGERLALRPGTLYDYTLAFGPQATVSVEQI